MAAVTPRPSCKPRPCSVMRWHRYARNDVPMRQQRNKLNEWGSKPKPSKFPATEGSPNSRVTSRHLAVGKGLALDFRPWFDMHVLALCSGV